MTRRMAFLIVALALGPALGGCSGSPKRSSAGKAPATSANSATSAPTSTTTVAGAANEGAGSGPGPSGAGGSQAAPGPEGTSQFCRTLAAKFSGPLMLMTKLSAASNPEEKRKVASQMVADNKAVQAAAPADVKPAVDTLAKGTADLADALAGGGPPRPEAMMNFMSPDSVKAVQQLTDYARNTCRIAQPNFV